MSQAKLKLAGIPTTTIKVDSAPAVKAVKEVTTATRELEEADKELAATNKRNIQQRLTDTERYYKQLQTARQTSASEEARVDDAAAKQRIERLRRDIQERLGAQVAGEEKAFAAELEVERKELAAKEEIEKQKLAAVQQGLRNQEAFEEKAAATRIANLRKDITERVTTTINSQKELETAQAAYNRNIIQAEENLARRRTAMARDIAHRSPAEGGPAEARGRLNPAVAQVAGVAGGMLAYAAVSSTYNAVKEVFSAGIDYNAKIESAGLAMQQMLGGDKKAADDLLESLQRLSLTSPFVFKDIVPQAQKLVAAGIAAKDVVPIMKALGDAAFATGKGAEGMDRLANAVLVMSERGKITGREVTQMARLGVDATKYLVAAYQDILPKGTQAATAAMTDMIKHGLIPADKAIKAITYGIEHDPLKANQMAAQAKTFSGQMTMLTDASNIFLGKAVRPLFLELERLLKITTDFGASKGMVTWADTIGEHLKDLITGAHFAADSIRGITGAGSDMLAMWMKVNPQIALAVDALKELNSVANNVNPVSGVLNYAAGVLGYGPNTPGASATVSLGPDHSITSDPHLSWNGGSNAKNPPLHYGYADTTAGGANSGNGMANAIIDQMGHEVSSNVHIKASCALVASKLLNRLADETGRARVKVTTGAGDLATQVASMAGARQVPLWSAPPGALIVYHGARDGARQGKGGSRSGYHVAVSEGGGKMYEADSVSEGTGTHSIHRARPGETATAWVLPMASALDRSSSRSFEKQSREEAAATKRKAAAADKAFREHQAYETAEGQLIGQMQKNVAIGIRANKLEDAKIAKQLERDRIAIDRVTEEIDIEKRLAIYDKQMAKQGIPAELRSKNLTIAEERIKSVHHDGISVDVANDLAAQRRNLAAQQYGERALPEALKKINKDLDDANDKASSLISKLFGPPTAARMKAMYDLEQAGVKMEAATLAAFNKSEAAASLKRAKSYGGIGGLMAAGGAKGGFFGALGAAVDKNTETSHGFVIEAQDRTMRMLEDAELSLAKTAAERLAIEFKYVDKLREGKVVMSEADKAAEASERAKQEQMASSQERLARVKSEAEALRATIQGSIEDGFSHGIESGVRSFAKGVLQMIREAEMRKLSAKITNRILGGDYADDGTDGNMRGNKRYGGFTPPFVPGPQQNPGGSSHRGGVGGFFEHLLGIGGGGQGADKMTINARTVVLNSGGGQGGMNGGAGSAPSLMQLFSMFGGSDGVGSGASMGSGPQGM